MIFGAAAVLGVLFFLVLLWAFVRGRSGLETLDALERFQAQAAVWLCLLIFAYKPEIGTAFFLALAVLVSLFPSQKPEAVYRKSIVFGALSVLWLETKAASPEWLAVFQDWLKQMRESL